MKGGFNSSFVEVRTIEGDKFLRDLKPNDLLLTDKKSFAKVKFINQRQANIKDIVYNVYYHTFNEEGVIDRVSGEQELIDGTLIKELAAGDAMLHRNGDIAIVDRLEKMETVNRFFYSIQLNKNTTFYANNICMKSDQL